MDQQEKIAEQLALARKISERNEGEIFVVYNREDNMYCIGKEMKPNDELIAKFWGGEKI